MKKETINNHDDNRLTIMITQCLLLATYLKYNPISQVKSFINSSNNYEMVFVLNTSGKNESKI